MPLTDTDLAALATADALALQRMQTRLQHEQAVAYAADLAANDAARKSQAAREIARDALYEADLAAAAVARGEQAEHRARTLALLEREAVAMEAAAAQQPTRADALLLKLYEANLAARKTAITSSTTDPVVDDMAADAMRMTVAVLPAAKVALGIA